MTQKQKKVYSYAMAVVSLVLSASIWTEIVSRVIYTVQAEEKETVVDYKAALIKRENDVDDVEYTHPAAVKLDVTKTNEVAEVYPRVEELSQWHIRRAYSLHIPSLNVRAPVLLPSMEYWSERKWDLLEEQMQAGLAFGTVAYPHSSNPINNGSLIIAGHSSPPNARAENSAFGDIFRSLPELDTGDEITLLVGNELLTYVVDTIAIVPSTATQILEQQTDESVLKLITCFPVGTTKDRLVVTAKKVDS